MDLRQEIEFFHITFCRLLLTTQDKSLIVMKGGCNLRFFLGSNRYSEDIDFDVDTIARETLRKRVEKTLDSTNLRVILASRKISIISHSAPKQTDTVQRWKVSLQFAGITVPSKIEFSRRGIQREGIIFESIDPILLSEYRLTPTFVSHYSATFAIEQKIEALAGRPETQARDVFDLDLLFSRCQDVQNKVPSSVLEQAIECAMSIDFDQFRNQVVEFLAEDIRAYYDSREVWNAMQLRVIRHLEELGK